MTTATSLVTFRNPTYDDIPLILDWILQDQEHAEKSMSPYFFFDQGAVSLVIEDDLGRPGLFVRVDPEPPSAVRLHIQFSPDPMLSAKTMLRAWPEFQERIWTTGINRMVFESISKKLIAFCSRAFHFERVGNTNDYELMREA